MKPKVPTASWRALRSLHATFSRLLRAVQFTRQYPHRAARSDLQQSGWCEERFAEDLFTRREASGEHRFVDERTRYRHLVQAPAHVLGSQKEPLHAHRVRWGDQLFADAHGIRVDQREYPEPEVAASDSRHLVAAVHVPCTELPGQVQEGFGERHVGSVPPFWPVDGNRALLRKHLEAINPHKPYTSTRIQTF